VEISCPAECEFLVSGQSRQALKKYVGQLSSEKDEMRRRMFYGVTRSHGGFLDAIEEEIVRFYISLRALTDELVLSAVQLLKETYRTEQKGVIFEHSSSNPIVGSLFRDLRQLLEASRQGTAETPSMGLEDVTKCLEVTEMNISYHLDSSQAKTSYLEFIRRNHPDVVAEDVGGGLIYP